MAFYLNVKNNKIINASNEPINTQGIKSYSVEEQVYYNYLSDEDKYIVQNNKIIEDPDYAEKVKKERETGFKEQFFETSLGWIRREPTLADGTKDNFLNNNLPLFAIALTTGQPVILPIAYELPDFTKELSEEYMKSLQIKNQNITQQFIWECMQVKMTDFSGQKAEV